MVLIGSCSIVCSLFWQVGTGATVAATSVESLRQESEPGLVRDATRSGGVFSTSRRPAASQSAGQPRAQQEEENQQQSVLSAQVHILLLSSVMSW